MPSDERRATSYELHLENCIVEKERKSSKENSARKGQATKGVWWMPWRREPKKDAANSEMPRGAVSKLRSGGVRMGKPTGCNGPVLLRSEEHTSELQSR